MIDDAEASDREAALKLWVVLARAQRTIAAHAKRDVERRGLTLTEFAALEALYHKGALTIGELGERVLLTSGSMTYVIDKLERRGLLDRVACPSDQRVTHVRITPAGRKCIVQIFPAHAEAIRQAMGGLSTEEKRRTTAALKRLGLVAHAKL